MAKKKDTFQFGKWLHAHIYWLVTIIAFTLFLYTGVQAILIHTANNHFIAFFTYMLSTLFLLIAIRTWSRGMRHYKYEF